MSKIMDVAKNVALAQRDDKEVNAIVKELFKDMKADLVYTILVDQETLLPMYMTTDMKMKLNANLPIKPGKSLSLKMDLLQKGNYEIYGLGESFTVPDVSNAKNMSELSKLDRNREKLGR